MVPMTASAPARFCPAMTIKVGMEIGLGMGTFHTLSIGRRTPGGYKAMSSALKDLSV